MGHQGKYVSDNQRFCNSDGGGGDGKEVIMREKVLLSGDMGHYKPDSIWKK